MPLLNLNNSGQTLQPGSHLNTSAQTFDSLVTQSAGRRSQVAGDDGRRGWQARTAGQDGRRGWQARMAGEATPRPASLDQYRLGSIRTSAPHESPHTKSKSAHSTLAADADPPPQLSRRLQSRCNAKHPMTPLSPPTTSIN